LRCRSGQGIRVGCWAVVIIEGSGLVIGWALVLLDPVGRTSSINKDQSCRF
jgi:hypothetical protein